MSGDRVVLRGVLHAIRTPKRPQGGGLLDRFVYQSLVSAGRIEQRFYPPTYYLLTGERSVQHPRYRLQYRFRGQPKAFSPDLRGHEVVVRAGLEPFGNGLGAMLDRPAVLEVGEYVQCPHHDDPYEEPCQGSARVYCMQSPTSEPEPDGRSGVEVVNDALGEVGAIMSELLGKDVRLSIGKDR